MSHSKKTTTNDGDDAPHDYANQYLQHFADFKKCYVGDEIVEDDENDNDYQQKSSLSMDEDYESDVEKNKNEKESEEEKSDDELESKEEEEEEEEKEEDEDEDEEEEEEEESVNFKSISHVYISVVPDRNGSLICYGFDIGSTIYGIQIVREISKSLHCDEYPTYYNEKHVFLINRIIEMAFYDSDDRDRYSVEENEEWQILSEQAFGKTLTSNDVGNWEKLHEQEIPECGFVVTTIVKCDDI
jgi:flagellar biosynthesis GTPase FlhF